jgi:hypothetical protein
MTPATSSWADAPLVVGQSFVDPLTGLTISPASVSASGATINVTFPTSSCTPAAPTMTFTPAGTIWTTAGAAITYNITVTNKDSCGCAASAYDLGATVPSSWGATLSRTASVSPGGSTTGSVVVSSPVAAAEDFYPVAVKATHTAATSLVAAGNATVAVAKGVAVTATSDKASYTLPKQKNTAVNALITTRVTSLGTNVSGAAVTVVVRDPSNKSVTLNSVTASDGTARVTYSMRARNSPLGTYTVTSTARVGSITGGAGTTFTAVNQ